MHTKNDKLAGVLFLLFLLTATPASAQRTSGAIGVGGQLGEPSGLTLKIYNPGGFSYDFLAAWDTNDFFFVNVHGLRERHLGTSPRVHAFYGPGAFVGLRDRKGDENDDVEAGISGTLGLGFLIERFEIYGQVTPRLALVPDTDGDVGGGIGLRYYFE